MSENEEKDASARKDEFTKKMSESKKQWTAIVRILTNRLKNDNIKDVYDIQAEAISHRQNVVEEVNIYAVKIHKLSQQMKVLSKARFEFYTTSYQVKTSGTEKLRMIESDLSKNQLFIDELDEHVNFLRETSKNLESINYSVKGRIELANILGGYK
jgi:Trp operon repressor